MCVELYFQDSISRMQQSLNWCTVVWALSPIGTKLIFGKSWREKWYFYWGQWRTIAESGFSNKSSIAIFGHETLSLGKVWEVAYTLAFYPRFRNWAYFCSTNSGFRDTGRFLNCRIWAWSLKTIVAKVICELKPVSGLYDYFQKLTPDCTKHPRNSECTTQKNAPVSDLLNTTLQKSKYANDRNKEDRPEYIYAYPIGAKHFLVLAETAHIQPAAQWLLAVCVMTRNRSQSTGLGPNVR